MTRWLCAERSGARRAGSRWRSQDETHRESRDASFVCSRPAPGPYAGSLATWGAAAGVARDPAPASVPPARRSREVCVRRCPPPRRDRQTRCPGRDGPGNRRETEPRQPDRRRVVPQGASALWKAVSKTLRPDISNTFEIKLRKGYRQNMALAERRRHRNVPETERRTTGEMPRARTQISTPVRGLSRSGPARPCVSLPRPPTFVTGAPRARPHAPAPPPRLPPPRPPCILRRPARSCHGMLSSLSRGARKRGCCVVRARGVPPAAEERRRPPRARRAAGSARGRSPSSARPTALVHTAAAATMSPRNRRGARRPPRRSPAARSCTARRRSAAAPPSTSPPRATRAGQAARSQRATTSATAAARAARRASAAAWRQRRAAAAAARRRRAASPPPAAPPSAGLSAAPSRRRVRIASRARGVATRSCRTPSP